VLKSRAYGPVGIMTSFQMSRFSHLMLKVAFTLPKLSEHIMPCTSKGNKTKHKKRWAGKKECNHRVERQLVISTLVLLEVGE